MSSHSRRQSLQDGSLLSAEERSHSAGGGLQRTASGRNLGEKLTTTNTANINTSTSGDPPLVVLNPREKLELENQQLLREVLTCRRNLDIAQQNVATLKALSNQLAQQLNTANNEIAILREKRDAGDLRNARELETKLSEMRTSYEKRLEDMRKDLEEQIDINTQLAAESQDSHRKADKSFKDIIATKDGLIAELTRTVECLQTGIKINHSQHNNNNNNSTNRSKTTTLSSPSRSNRSGNQNQPNSYDAIEVRNSIIEPTMDLLRLSLRVLKDDVAKRQTRLGGEVNSSFYTSEKKPVTRYFVDVQADKHRMDEVPTVDLSNAFASNRNSFSAATPPQWPRVWKFHTPQGELITLSLDVESL